MNANWLRFGEHQSAGSEIILASSLLVRNSPIPHKTLASLTLLVTTMSSQFASSSLRIAARSTTRRASQKASSSVIARTRPVRAISSKSFPDRRANFYNGATLATSSSRMAQPQPRPLRERPIQGMLPRIIAQIPVSFILMSSARSMFIQTESTPNEDSVKFIPGVPVMESGSAEFLDTRSSLASPLAIRLIGIEGVKAIFYGPDFITVSKDSSVAWSILKPEIYSILMEFFSSGQPLFKSEEDRDSAGPQDTRILDTDSEVIAMIKELLDTRVRPAIMEDGGDIEYRGFNEDDGVVQVKLKGSCRGCSSSTVTLKSGIERMLMHYIPEVKGVEQVRHIFRIHGIYDILLTIITSALLSPHHRFWTKKRPSLSMNSINWSND